MDLLILVMLVIHLIMNSIILFRLNRDDWEWFFSLVFYLYYTIRDVENLKEDGCYW